MDPPSSDPYSRRRAGNLRRREATTAQRARQQSIRRGTGRFGRRDISDEIDTGIEFVRAIDRQFPLFDAPQVISSTQTRPKMSLPLRVYGLLPIPPDLTPSNSTLTFTPSLTHSNPPSTFPPLPTPSESPLTFLRSLPPSDPPLSLPPERSDV